MEWNMTKPPLGSQIDWGHPLSKGIVGCWLFNEGQGDKVNDISGNKNTGTLTNFSHPATVTSGWNPGKFGKGIRFSGGDNFISINSTVLNATKALTMTIGIVIKSLSADMQIIGKPYNVLAAPPYTIISSVVNNTTGTLLFGLTGNDYNRVLLTSQRALLLNTPYIISQTWDGSIMRQYINGIVDSLYANLSKNLLSNTNILNFGRSGINEYPNYFNGRQEFIYFHNRALSPQEVRQLYINPFCFIK